MLPCFNGDFSKMQSADSTSAVTQALFNQVLLSFAEEFPCACRTDTFLSLKSVTWTKSYMAFETGRRSGLYKSRHFATFRKKGKGPLLRDCSHPSVLQYPVPLLNVTILEGI